MGSDVYEERYDTYYEGYSSSDLYDPDPDDLSHLTQLNSHHDEAEVEMRESDPDKESATVIREAQCLQRSRSPFEDHGRISFKKIFESLGSKWELATGKVVEATFYNIGSTLDFYSPVHSFMADCNDSIVASSFTTLEWAE